MRDSNDERKLLGQFPKRWVLWEEINL